MSEICDHPPQCVVEDLHDGTYVCTACARVLDGVVFQSPPSTPVAWENYDSDYHHERASLVVDMCYNGNLPNCVLLTAQQIHDGLKGKLAKFRFSQTEIAAYVIYKALQKESMPHSPSEVQHITSIMLPRIWDIENILNTETFTDKVMEISHYVRRYGAYCDMKYKDIEAICEHIGEANDICLNHAPANIAAALLYKYSKNSVYGTVQSIAKLCNVSACSVYSILRLLKQVN